MRETYSLTKSILKSATASDGPLPGMVNPFAIDGAGSIGRASDKRTEIIEDTDPNVIMATLRPEWQAMVALAWLPQGGEGIRRGGTWMRCWPEGRNLHPRRAARVKYPQSCGQHHTSAIRLPSMTRRWALVAVAVCATTAVAFAWHTSAVAEGEADTGAAPPASLKAGETHDVLVAATPQSQFRVNGRARTYKPSEHAAMDADRSKETSPNGGASATELAEQSAFAAFADSIRTGFPDDFAAAGVPGEVTGSRDYFIAVADEPDAELRRHLEASPVPAKVLYGAGLSENELADLCGKVMATLVDTLPNPEGLWAGPSITGDGVRVHYSQDGNDEATVKDAIATTVKRFDGNVGVELHTSKSEKFSS